MTEKHHRRIKYW